MQWTKINKDEFLEEEKSKNPLKLSVAYGWIARHIPFFLFLSFLAALYIANGHYAIKNKREITELQTAVKELNWDYLESKNKLMYESKMSRISKKVEEQGLELSNEPSILVQEDKK